MRQYDPSAFKKNSIINNEIVYDLTEVVLASAGRLKYYGIVRVVAEIGAALKKQNPDIRFGVFSYGHNAMLEVFPVVTESGDVDLRVPEGIRQLRIRRAFHTKSAVRDFLLPVVQNFVDRRNRRVWEQSGANLQPIDMEGKVLLSCGRPKLIVDIMESLKDKVSHFDVIPLLHDMIPLHDFYHSRGSFPRNFVGDNKIAVSRAKAIFTNSRFTKGEIHHFHQEGVFPDIPEVFALPLVHECPRGDEQLNGALPDRPYILAVGTSLGRKNVEAVFDAMLLMHETGQTVPDFVLAGARRKRTDTYLQDSRFDPIRDRIAIWESPNQAELVNLYQNAVALVLASRMEGWGLPAGEALWLGTPAVCAAVPALQEVCGDLGLYFDPDAPQELADILTKLLEDPGFEADMRSRIASARPDLRTWTHVGRDFLKALEKIPA